MKFKIKNNFFHPKHMEIYPYKVQFHSLNNKMKIMIEKLFLLKKFILFKKFANFFKKIFLKFMNQIFLNLSIFSLNSYFYSNSPIFSSNSLKLKLSNSYLEKSFSNVFLNMRYLQLFNTNFKKILKAPIEVQLEPFIITGNINSSMNLENLPGEIMIQNCVFLQSNGALFYNSNRVTTVTIISSNFLRIQGDGVILFSGGSDLFINHCCFYAVLASNLVTFDNNNIQVNASSFFNALNEIHSVINLYRCSSNIINNNISEAYSTNTFNLNNMHAIRIQYLTCSHSMRNLGFCILNNAMQSDIRNLYIIDQGNNNRPPIVFSINMGSFSIYNSYFNVMNMDLASITNGFLTFVQCFSLIQFTNSYIITKECFEYILNPPSYSVFNILMCNEGNISGLVFNTPYTGNLEGITIPKINDSEILAIILIFVLALVILIIIIWIIFYFLICKNDMTKFSKEDHEEIHWNQRWNWVLKNTQNGNSAECSDIELKLIERSDDAANRRRNALQSQNIFTQIANDQLHKQWDIFNQNNDGNDNQPQQIASNSQTLIPPQTTQDQTLHTTQAINNTSLHSLDPNDAPLKPSAPKKVKHKPVIRPLMKSQWDILKEAGVDESLGSPESSDSWNKTEKDLPKYHHKHKNKLHALTQSFILKDSNTQSSDSGNSTDKETASDGSNWSDFSGSLSD